MEKEKESELVEEIASTFFELLCEIDENWKKAYFRFCYWESSFDSSGSFESGDSEICILDCFDHSEVFDSICELSSKLFQVIQKNKGLILVVVNCDGNFEILFEFDNLKKWEITLMDGKSGIPEGYVEGA